MDWREFGRRLRELRRQSISDGLAEYAEECETSVVCKETNEVMLVPNNYMGVDDLDPEFRGALWGHFHRDQGSLSPLVQYLMSERPLGSNERRALAAVLAATNDDSSIGIGRPQDTELRLAATTACIMYHQWCQFNKKNGIPDHGHRGEMKDIAARVTVEDFFAWRYATPYDEYRF